MQTAIETIKSSPSSYGNECDCETKNTIVCSIEVVLFSFIPSSHTRSPQSSSRACQVIQRCRADCGPNKAKARAGCNGEGVLQSEPPGVDFAKQPAASNLVPVSLRVVNAGDGLVLGRTADRPSCLSYPDGLACSGGYSGVVRLEEERFGVGDAVCLGVLRRCHD